MGKLEGILDPSDKILQARSANRLCAPLPTSILDYRRSKRKMDGGMDGWMDGYSIFYHQEKR